MRTHSRRSFVLVAAAIALTAGPAAAVTDLWSLSDEFEDAVTLPLWRRVHIEEQWNAEQLQTWDIDVTTQGRMTMVPYTVTWFQDYRGPYAFKKAGGDFVVTTDVTATARDGASVPASIYSLGGILIRTPRDVTPATWTPGGEHYVFLSLGYSSGPVSFQYEVKTTTNSVSNLNLSPAPGPSARLQLARLGPYVITLRSEPGQPWVVHRRYTRGDFPESLQVGLVAYTDWGKVQVFSPFVHNGNVLNPPLPPGVTDPQPGVPYRPDLRATFEYLRFYRPEIPAPLLGRDLSDPAQVSNTELLAFLGDHAIETGPLAVHDRPGGASTLSLAIHPNPFALEATISYSVARAGIARVAVRDLTGRRVRDLGSGQQEAGAGVVRWDGRDAAGAEVPTGIYWVEITAGGERFARRLLRIR